MKFNSFLEYFSWMLADNLRRFLFITGFINFLFALSAASVTAMGLAYIQACDPQQNVGAPLKVMPRYNWPLQCDLACIRYKDDASNECNSWSWNRITSECKLFDSQISENWCSGGIDENTLFAVKSFVFSKDEFNARGYHFSLDSGVTMNKTWNECGPLNEESNSAVCDERRFAVIKALVETKSDPLYNFMVDPEIPVWTGYRSDVKFWVARKRHGGFAPVQRRINRDTLHACLFPAWDQFDIRFFATEFAEVDTGISKVYFCMDQSYCSDFVEFDMCRKENKGCYPKVKGSCPVEDKPIFSFFTALKQDIAVSAPAASGTYANTA